MEFCFVCNNVILKNVTIIIRNHIHHKQTDSREKSQKQKSNIYTIDNLNKNNGSVVAKNSSLGINLYIYTYIYTHTPPEDGL
jgi:hypothetical protein